MRPQLSSVIAQIRNELIQVDNERLVSGQEPVLQLGQVEVELQFLVEESSTLKGGFDLKVVTLGGNETYNDKTIQRVKLTLLPATSNQGRPGTLYKKTQESRQDEIGRL